LNQLLIPNGGFKDASYKNWMYVMHVCYIKFVNAICLQKVESTTWLTLKEYYIIRRKNISNVFHHV